MWPDGEHFRLREPVFGAAIHSAVVMGNGRVPGSSVWKARAHWH